MAKETYHMAKETYHVAKETYNMAKETHVVDICYLYMIYIHIHVCTQDLGQGL